MWGDLFVLSLFYALKIEFSNFLRYFFLWVFYMMVVLCLKPMYFLEFWVSTMPFRYDEGFSLEKTEPNCDYRMLGKTDLCESNRSICANYDWLWWVGDMKFVMNLLGGTPFLLVGDKTLMTEESLWLCNCLMWRREFKFFNWCRKFELAPYYGSCNLGLALALSKANFWFCLEMWFTSCIGDTFSMLCGSRFTY